MDPKVLQRIAEGHYAEQVLDVFGDLLLSLTDETLRRADTLREKRELTPELSLAILHEVGAYRTILQRLRQKVRRAELSRAVSLPANGDGLDAATDEVLE